MENIKNNIISQINALSKTNESKIINEIVIKKMQVDYPHLDKQPRSIIDLIRIFKKIHERIIKSFNATKYDTFKNGISIQIKEIKECLGKYKDFNEGINIAVNYPNNAINLEEEKKTKLDKLYKKFMKEYDKSNKKLLERIKYLFKSFGEVYIKLKSLVESREENINEFEEIGNFLMNIKDDNPEVNEGRVKMYTSYVKSVESFKKYEEFNNQIMKEEENWKKEKLFEKLKKLGKDINDEIEKNKNIFQDIENYFPKININIDELNSIENISIKNLGYFKNYRIESDKLYNNNKMRIDILIILDITNSMGKFLKIIKEKIKFIVKKIKENCPLSIVYLGFIGYKDFEDLILGDEYIDIDFTVNIDEVYNKIKDLYAEGGADIPEDVAGAFELALKKSWGEGKKLAVLITDSPCHGIQFHDLDQKNEKTKDNYPNGKFEPKNESENIEEFVRRDMNELVKLFADREICLLCLDILKNTKIMFDKFKNIYKNQNKSELFLIKKVKTDNKNTLDNIIIENATNLSINVEDILNDLKKNFDK